MSYELREGQFNLFPNDKKGNEKAPSYKGDGLLNGRVYEAAIWIRQGNRGEFMRMVVKEKSLCGNIPKEIIRKALDDYSKGPELPLKMPEAVPGDDIDPLPF